MKKSPKFQKSRNDDFAKELITIFKKHDIPIIVEGKKDLKTLEQLGVTNKIYHLAGKPLYEFCENLAKRHTEVLVLTDYDRKGKQLAAQIADFLKRFGVKTNMHLRREIFVGRGAHVESFKNSGK